MMANRSITATKGFNKTMKVLTFIGKLAIGLIIISPLLIGFSMSFMSTAEMASIPPHLIPENPVTYTYKNAVKSVPIGMFMINSITVSVIVIIAQVITCSLAAYAFAFFEFKAKAILFFIVLSTMMIPVDSIIIANSQTIASMNMKDTIFGLVAPYLTSAMGIFLMRQHYLTIPKSLQEASTIDGAGPTRFLFSVVIPMSKPAIASLGIYVFIQTYNQFLWPLLVTDVQEKRTVQVGISMLQMAEAVDYGIVLAGSILILIPVVLIFIIGHRQLVEGITAGAVKG